ncbi:MAG: hypothetical protein V9E81_05200 [Marmoricola sp.]
MVMNEQANQSMTSATTVGPSLLGSTNLGLETLESVKLPPNEANWSGLRNWIRV